MEALLSKWRPRILSVLRIVTAFLFILRGAWRQTGWVLPRPLRSGGIGTIA